METGPARRKSIAHQLGTGRNTVRRALASDGPPKYQRLTKRSIVDTVEPQIRQLLAQWPTVPTTVTAERISWTRSLTVLKDRVTGVVVVVPQLGPESRTDYRPGSWAQCGMWFPPVDIPLDPDSSAGRRYWSW